MASVLKISQILHPTANVPSLTINSDSTVSFDAGILNVTGPINGVIGANTPYTGTFTTLNASGNLNFTGTGNRITGDFSNATHNNRIAFQTSIINGNTTVNAIPNGTASTSQFIALSSADLDNSSRAGFNTSNSIAIFFADKTGTGTFLPMAFYTGGGEKMRLDTSGNFGIGTTSPVLGKLNVTTGFSATDTTSRSLAFFSSSDTYTPGSSPSGLYFSYTGAASLASRTADISTVTFGSGTLGALSFQLGKMTLDTTGNLGLGVTPSSWASGWAPIQFSGDVSVSRAGIARNTYYDGSNYRYITSAAATLFQQSSGIFYWFTGGSGTAGNTVSFVQTMILNSNGDLGVGAATSPYSRIEASASTGSYWNNSNGWVNGVPSAVTVTSTTPGGYDATIIGRMTDSGGTSKNAWAIGSVGTGPWTAGNDSTQAASLYFAIRNTVGGITERMRITSIGMVGIGTTGPARRLVVSNGNAEGVEIGPGNTSGDPVGAVSFIYYNRNSSVYVQNIQDASSHFFRVNGTNRGVFNTSGDFALGKTTASEATSSGSGFGFAAASVDPFFSVVNTSGVNSCIYLNKRNTSSSSGFINFASNDGTNTTGVGSITHNGTNTSYNTSSDYRLKNIEGLLTNSGSYIDSLRPVHGTWKSTGKKFIGLIAHEAQAVSQTDVATGEKDGEEMQAMDYSNPEFIANIIAELQSLRKRVAELESTR